MLIVAGHSISTGIELDYTNLGILKSQGFGSGRIRLSILLQYLLAELVGSIIGIFAAIPLISVIASVFDPISGYITETHLALGQTLLYLLCIFAASAVFIIFITHKVCKISPIRAISGGRREIYFDLDREFNVDIITTVPNVEYHVYMSDGTMVKIES
ncbi:MAG: FtsX-like permease family protein, partial [Spirochaetales bacterium]|nr:FtsX-like permease family protein [Spirochaetales bacterium]